MKTRTIWIIVIQLLIYRTLTYSQEYIQSIKQLTFEKTIDYYPVWSPDGKFILYAGRGEISNIYKLPSTSSEGESVLLTKVPSGHPQWSPDGFYISFDNYETKNIQIMSPYGGTPVHIIPVKIPGERKRQTCWSPDSKGIAFYADGDIYTLDLYSGMFNKIYHNDESEAWPFCWSSDSLGLLIVLKNKISSDGDIWSISSNGSSPQQLTDFQGNETHPDLSPDGSMIVFTSNLSGNMEIWIMSVSSKVKLQLTHDASRDMNPRWSPNGDKIVFASERSGNRDIWIMELDMSNLKKELGIKKSNTK